MDSEYYMSSFPPIWPEVFRTGDIEGREDLLLCADALSAWGNTYIAEVIPENFGEVMAKIASKLGVLGTPESFMGYADRMKGE